MPIAWRPAVWADIEPGLAIQEKNRGDTLVGLAAATDGWKQLARSPFFASAVLEATPPIQGHRLMAFGASVIVSAAFADAEIHTPRPDINSRIIAAMHSGLSPVATRRDVALLNAGEGVDVVVLCGNWRDEICSPADRQELQILLASTFVNWHAGFRIRRILSETVDEPSRRFAQGSVVYRPIAEFPGTNRVLHLMNRDSVRAVHAHLGNLLFTYRDPVLRLRDSDQQLLSAALQGATDSELAPELGIRFSAVKARWRSTFQRFAEARPDLLRDAKGNNGRGPQKRHRVLAYVRAHPEELRPYAWQETRAALTASQR